MTTSSLHPNPDDQGGRSEKVTVRQSRFVRHWTGGDGRSKTWGWRVGGGYRLQVQLMVHRHRYHSTPDRWVFQPSLTWDRKR